MVDVVLLTNEFELWKSSALMGEKLPSFPEEFKNCSTAEDVFVHLNVFFKRLSVAVDPAKLSYASLTCADV